MAIGVLAFLLTPIVYGLWGIDTDVLGLIILFAGLAICVTGIICRKKLYGWKLVVLGIIAAVLSIPVIILIVTTIIFLITGKPV